jgi:hypothetical protein
LTTPTAEAIRENVAEVEQNIEKMDKIWAVYMSTDLTADEKIWPINSLKTDNC